MSTSAAPKQHLSAALKIRERILQGHLPPGTRVTEAALAEQLGLSRTPVRQALPALAKDGLLVPVGKRGFAVRGFTTEESRTALETRAALEGLAAKAAAEKGLSATLLEAFRHCLVQGDAVLAPRELSAESHLAYGQMNDRFHALILEAADQPLLAELVARCEAVPFVSPATIAFGSLDSAEILGELFFAHRQHHHIVEALSQRDGARAEMLLREHARVQRHSMTL